MTPRRRIRIQATLIASALTMSLALAPSAAFAQTTPKRPAGATAPKGAGAKPGLNDAKTHYLAGEAKFKSADYAGALADFQAADAIKATPHAARFIGLCQDKLGHLPEALAAYDRFLADVPAKLAKEGEEIKARAAEIKALPGKVHAESTPSGATVLMDGKSVGGAYGTPTDFDAPPGHHALHFSAEGRLAVDKDIDVTFASKQDVSVTLEPSPGPVAAVVAPPVSAVTAGAPAPAAPPPPPAEPRSKLPAYVTGGLAIVAAGVGTAFGVVALGDKSDFDKNPTTGKADDGENHALIADMAFGVAITLGVTSAVLFLTKDEAPAAPAAKNGHTNRAAYKPYKVTVTPSPIVTPHGGGAGALVRF